MAESDETLPAATNGMVEASKYSAYQNNGYEATNEDSSINLPARRLPPLTLEIPKANKKKYKSPRLQHKTEKNNENGGTPNGDTGNERPSSGNQKKRRGRHRPTSAESKTSSISPTSQNDTLEFDTTTPLNGRSKLEDALPSTVSTNEHIIDGTPSTRPKDPRHKKREVAVEVEKPSDEEEVDTNTLTVSSRLRNASSTSLRAFETVALDEDCENIEVISDEPDVQSARYIKVSSPSILKNSSDHVTAMFQAGSRPSSAGSSKHNVRIADEVTYSSDSLSKVRPKSSRPRSAKRESRPKSANGHVKNNSQTNGFSFRLKQTTQVKVSPHFKTSIFSLVACGVFAGAAALYYSFLTRRAMKDGDDEAARKYSWYSKLFNILGICSGTFIFFVVVVYYNVNKYGGDKAS